jgi:hypothetical protein
MRIFYFLSFKIKWFIHVLCVFKFIFLHIDPFATLVINLGRNLNIPSAFFSVISEWGLCVYVISFMEGTFWELFYGLSIFQVSLIPCKKASPDVNVFVQDLWLLPFSSDTTSSCHQPSFWYPSQWNILIYNYRSEQYTLSFSRLYNSVGKGPLKFNWESFLSYLLSFISFMPLSPSLLSPIFLSQPFRLFILSSLLPAFHPNWSVLH